VVWTAAAGGSVDPPVTAETKPSNSRRANASNAHAIGGSAGVAGLLPAIGPSTMPTTLVTRLLTIFSGFGGATGAGCAVGCTVAEDNAKVVTDFSADAAGAVAAGAVAAGSADSFFAAVGCGSEAAATAWAEPFFVLWAALSSSMVCDGVFFVAVFVTGSVTGSGFAGLVGGVVSVGCVLPDFPVLVWASTTPDGTGPDAVCDGVCVVPSGSVGSVASDGLVDDGVDVVADGGELGLTPAPGVESVSDAEAAPGAVSEVDDVLDVVSTPSAEAMP